MSVERARAELLGGRGPGASPAEITHHTRARLRIGGRSTVDRRAALADRTAVARGDTGAVDEHPAAVAGHPGADAAAPGPAAGDPAVRHRMTPSLAGSGVRLDLATLALAVVLAVVTTRILHDRRLRCIPARSGRYAPQAAITTSRTEKP